ncbi:hypothetical protein PPO43_07925 [Saprospira sp. CCB-QB6]|uniref:hypothetical protein n=1 Tax=Saprospira sp. CCB-QB6 TaxID=3023936 RepID=UPI00234973E6|nr:hypothetical protein [Saprospira sp. CCB-QB6]WCL83013.1 hypothetical protein PPO43_07925 [Saprospira sp. CCB-QB6]
MLRITKYRLLLDLSIQLILFILWAVQAALHFSYFGVLYYSSIFVLLLSAWQLLHAFYVVRKHQDWHRKQYLQNMRQLLAYSLITIGIGLFMLLASFGFLAPFFIFSLHILHWVICLVALYFAGHYFWTSIRQLQDYINRPKSFWDL